MNKFEFISYTPTPQEKYLGIVCIKIYSKFIVRFKIVQTKDGQNTFPAPPSFKIGEQYYHSFEFDSNSEKREFDDFVKASLKSAQSPSPKVEQMFQPEIFPDNTANFEGCPF